MIKRVTIVAFLVSSLFLFSCQNSEAIIPESSQTIEPACEWPCTEEDKQTAVAWFATLDAGQTPNLPTNTPVPTLTQIVIPTLVSNSQLPDLTVTAISDPICVPETEGTIIEFNVFVRNIGKAGTSNFGRFNIGVYFILGQSKYSLNEWAEQFNGVVGTSNMEVFNLGPGQDIKLTVVIDLLGNKNLGIEVIANSGENPIREMDMTDNTLLKYFSVYCQ